MLRDHLDRHEAAQLFVVRQVDVRHALVRERPYHPVARCCERLVQSFSSFCFFFFSRPLCLPRSCGCAGGMHRIRETRSFAAEARCSWKGAGTCPALIEASVSCCSCCARLAARQASPAARACATSSLRAASGAATAAGSFGGGATRGVGLLPQPARQTAAAKAAITSGRLVRVFLRCKLQGTLPDLLEVTLLDRDSPLDEILHAAVPRP